MQDKETPKVDLGKRPDLDTPRSNDLEGNRDTYPGTGSSNAVAKPKSRASAITIVFLLIILIIFASIAFAGRGSKPAPVPAAPAPVAPAPAAPVPAVAADSEKPEPEPEPVDHRETARGKICRAIAREFLAPPSPTREQQNRTLMIYNINRCSNGFIADAYAEKLDLSKDEAEAVNSDTDFGPLRVEDE